jgi:hypothetical protein
LSSGNLSNKREKAASKVARILNSAMAFMIAYLGIMFFFYLSTAIMGKFFGFDAQVYYFGVKFQLGRHKWTPANAFWTWSFGTFFTVFLGVICSYLYHYFKEKVALGNLRALWGAVIAYSSAAAQGVLPILASGDNDHSPFYTNLSIAFNFLGLPIPVLYIICIIFMILLVLVSTNISKSFLSFSYSYSKVNKRDRKRKYYFETVLIPFVLASFLLLMFFQQTYQYANFVVQNIVYLIVIGSALILSLFVINISDMKSDDVLRYKSLQQISAAFFVILMMILVFLAVTFQGFYLPF